MAKKRGYSQVSSEKRESKKVKSEEESSGGKGAIVSLKPKAKSPQVSNEKRSKKIKSEEESSGGECEGVILTLKPKAKKPQAAKSDSNLSLVGPPIPATEARQRWPLRYQSKNKTKKVAKSSGEIANEGDDDILQARAHYNQAMVDGELYDLGDHAYVKAEDGSPDYIARIVELFETTDNISYFKAQWFYRAEDTVIKDHVKVEESKRVFLSEVMDDNPLNCIVQKIDIVEVTPNMDLTTKQNKLPTCDLYYDMKYNLPFLTFSTIKSDNAKKDSGTSSTISSEVDSTSVDVVTKKSLKEQKNTSVMYLLDLYSGCGAMSTGLCMGASLAGVELVTRWAVDFNEYACKSLKKNHPETEVRNEAAEDFLSLLKEWEKLCKKFSLLGLDSNSEISPEVLQVEEEVAESEEDDGSELSSEEFEVERLLSICYGDPNEVKKPGLYFKVRWKGYGPSDDTWEPVEGLSNCEEKLEEFVKKGYKANILPLPGTADFICGGPPCQGISGFNRFRNAEDPLADPKNHQLVVFMNIVEYLKPKYVLMENVVDILKFADGKLGRYAIGRLVDMNYQARMGMMAAGSYGLPQFRNRVFLWGAQPDKSLPQYALPTHEVVSKGHIPVEFEDIVVAYEKNNPCQLEDALCLGDAISDLPPVTNDEVEDERRYGTSAKTEFQKFIRIKRKDMVCSKAAAAQDVTHVPMLYDHQPLKLNDDDYERVIQIPKKKGANFRNLPGVLVGDDNKVYFDPSMKRVYLQNGKPLVPEYAMKFVKGRSTKPFARLWWDEIVATVVTRAEPHNQAILHPVQDRVLTIRENARLQGFPDCYKLYGPFKQRYMQVGNAVAVPVAIALGYNFGLATQELNDEKPLMTLPFKFPNCLKRTSAETKEDNSD